MSAGNVILLPAAYYAIDWHGWLQRLAGVKRGVVGGFYILHGLVFRGADLCGGLTLERGGRGGGYFLVQRCWPTAF